MYGSFQVAEFSPMEVKPNQITFKWTLPPDEENGVLLGFKIKYGIKVRIVNISKVMLDFNMSAVKLYIFSHVFSRVF